MKIFISGATRQTQPYRDAIIELLQLRGDAFELLCMERWGGGTAAPLEVCLENVRECDLFLFLWSPNLGSKVSSLGITITQAEYREAIESGCEVLVFLPKPEAYSSEEWSQVNPEASELREELQNLQEGHTGVPFGDREDVMKILFQHLVTPRASTPSLADEPVERQGERQEFLYGRYSLMPTSSLIGRSTERELLASWLSGDGDVGGDAVMAIVAHGGMGKSALAWHWLREEIGADPDIEAVVWFSFYESGATYSDFVSRVSRALLPELPAEAKTGDREEALLRYFDEKRCVVVLDGLERILIGYTRLDAQRRDEAELDDSTDNVVESGSGVDVDSTSSDDFDALGGLGTFQSNPEMARLRKRALREAADSRADRFLRCLAGLKRSKVLITTRLMPAALQHGYTAIAGVYSHWLEMLEIDDGVELLRSLGIRGREETFTHLVEGCNGYALLLSKIAGRIKKDDPENHDLDAWLAAHEGQFDPWSLQDDLVNQKHHVLEYALAGVDQRSLAILKRLAVARGPLELRVILDDLVGEERAFAGLGEFDEALRDLRERGLVGVAEGTGDIDLHPLIRGRVWSLMSPEDRKSVSESLSETIRPRFEAEQKDSENKEYVNAEHLFYFLVDQERIDDAWEVLRSIIYIVGNRLGDYSRVCELIEMFIANRPVGEWHTKLALCVQVVDRYEWALITCGRTRDAQDVLERALELEGLTTSQRESITGGLQFALYNQGRIDRSIELGLECLATCNESTSGGLLYLAYALISSKDPRADAVVALLREIEAEKMSLPMFEAWFALHDGRPEEALAHAERFAELAEESGGHERRILARSYVGAALVKLERFEKALPKLEHSLRGARSLGLTWNEDWVSVRLAIALWRLGSDSVRVSELLNSARYNSKRDHNLFRFSDSQFVAAQVAFSKDHVEAAEFFAHQALRCAWGEGPPFYDKILANEIFAWMEEHGMEPPADLKRRDPADTERLEALDFDILEAFRDRWLSLRKEARLKKFRYSQTRVLSEAGLQDRLGELEPFVAPRDATHWSRAWWDEQTTDLPLRTRVALVERLFVRDATIDDLRMSWFDGNAKSMEAALCYLDYSRLKEQHSKKDSDEPVVKRPVGDALTPVDHKSWSDPWTAGDQQSMQLEIERLEQAIRVEDMGETGRVWWNKFKEENPGREGLILRLAMAIHVLGATASEFFLAYVYSNTDNIAANLYYMRFTRLQRIHQERGGEFLAAADEKVLDTRPAYKTLDECAGCGAPVKSDAPNCHACGFELNEAAAEES